MRPLFDVIRDNLGEFFRVEHIAECLKPYDKSKAFASAGEKIASLSQFRNLARFLERLSSSGLIPGARGKVDQLLTSFARRCENLKTDLTALATVVSDMGLGDNGLSKMFDTIREVDFAGNIDKLAEMFRDVEISVDDNNEIRLSDSKSSDQYRPRNSLTLRPNSSEVTFQPASDSVCRPIRLVSEGSGSNQQSSVLCPYPANPYSPASSGFKTGKLVVA